jgi:hypothetical protein
MSSETVQCNVEHYSVLGVNYVLGLLTAIGVLEAYRLTNQRLYLAMEGLVALHFISVSFAMAGCIVDSFTIYRISTVLGYFEMALFETLVIYRFNVFSQLVSTNVSFLVVVGVLYWLVALTTVTSFLLGYRDVFDVVNFMFAPMSVVIELTTGVLSLTVVLSAFRNVEQYIVADPKLAGIIISRSKRVVFLLVTMVLLIVAMTVNSTLFGAGSSLTSAINSALMMLIGMSSVTIYYYIVEIIKFKAQVMTTPKGKKAEPGTGA